MHSPIFYGVIKEKDHALPDYQELKDVLPSSGDMFDHIPELDWVVVDTGDEDDADSSMLTPEDVLELSQLDGLAETEFTDDSKTWVKMTITKDSAIQYLIETNKIKRQFLDVLDKGLAHGVIVDSLISTKHHPGVFTDADSAIGYKHYDRTTRFGGLRLFAYSKSEWSNGNLAHEYVLAANQIAETLAYELNEHGIFELYIPTGIIGDYHF